MADRWMLVSSVKRGRVDDTGIFVCDIVSIKIRIKMRKCFSLELDPRMRVEILNRRGLKCDTKFYTWG